MLLKESSAYTLVESSRTEPFEVRRSWLQLHLLQGQAGVCVGSVDVTYVMSPSVFRQLAACSQRKLLDPMYDTAAAFRLINCVDLSCSITRKLDASYLWSLGMVWRCQR